MKLCLSCTNISIYSFITTRVNNEQADDTYIQAKETTSIFAMKFILFHKNEHVKSESARMVEMSFLTKM